MKFFERPSAILNLENDELKILTYHKMINHSMLSRGTDFEKIMKAKMQSKRSNKKLLRCYIDLRQRDYFQAGDFLKKRKIISINIDETKTTREGTLNLKIKRVAGSQSISPITKWFYDEETFELVIERKKPEKEDSSIHLFSYLELNLLDPSYIISSASKASKVPNLHLLMMICACLSTL